jgi:hypothetical protein
MTIAKQIESARKHLEAGNYYAYAAQISAGIRSAMSDRAAKSFRKAIDEDGTADWFHGLNTTTPTAWSDLPTI